MKTQIPCPKPIIQSYQRFGFIGLFLSSFLLANFAHAAVDYWDPQGTTGANPYTGTMTGIWENNDWSTSNTGSATPTAWAEADAACFGINSGIGTPAYTVTM